MDYLLRTDLSDSLKYKIAVYLNMIIFFIPFVVVYFFKILKDNIVMLIGFILTAISFVLSFVKLSFIIVFILKILSLIEIFINAIIATVLTLFTIPNHFLV